MQKIKITIEILACILFGLIVVSPMYFIGKLHTLIALGGYAIPKFIIGYLLIKNRKILRKLPLIIKKGIWSHQSTEKLVFGVPVSKLIDFLLTTQSFKREGINGARNKLGLSMKNYENLAKRMENNEILVRGEKNARILNPEYSKQKLLDFFENNNNRNEVWFDIHKIESPA